MINRKLTSQYRKISDKKKLKFLGYFDALIYHHYQSNTGNVTCGSMKEVLPKFPL